MHFFVCEKLEKYFLSFPPNTEASLTEGMHTVAKAFLFNVSCNYTVSPGRDREFGNLLA